MVAIVWDDEQPTRSRESVDFSNPYEFGVYLSVFLGCGGNRKRTGAGSAPAGQSDLNGRSGKRGRSSICPFNGNPNPIKQRPHVHVRDEIVANAKN